MWLARALSEGNRSMDLINLVIVLVLIGLAFWIVRELAPTLRIPDPIVRVIYVILVVIFVLFLLSVLTGRTFISLR